MKRLLLIVILFCAGFVSCDEENVSPSYADTDRVEELLDMSKPLVKEYKEKYGVNILYEFNDTLDFKFGFYTTSANPHWQNVIIHHLDSMEVVDFALEQLDAMVFAYFADEFKQRLPHKLLLADIVETGSINPDNLMSEPDVEEEGTVTAIANEYSYLLAFNKTSMESFSEARLKDLRDVKLYHLISYVMDKEDLYAEIPEEFYSQVSYLHGASVDSIAGQEEEQPVGTGPYRYYYTPDWYMGLGMALTIHSPNESASSNFDLRLRIDNSLYFPDRERDFRNFLCVMIFMDEDDLREFYLPFSLFCERMRIAMRLLQGWGVDVLKINPALEMFQE